MTQRYAPPSAAGSPRYTGLGTYARLPFAPTTERADFGIVGVPFDLGASFRPGPRFGPAAVREGSRLIRRANPFHQIDVYEHLSGVDYGDTPQYPSDLARSLEAIEEFLRPIVKNGVVPISIGGDHTIPLAILRVLAKEKGTLSLVQFDSHTDTDDMVFGTKINHGTTFRRAAEEGLVDPRSSIQVGIRGSMAAVTELDEARELGFGLIEAHEMLGMTAGEIAKRVLRRVGTRNAYLTFDIDFLDPAYAPGTGTPEIGGPSTREAIAILRALTEVNFVGFDVVEVSPPYDHGQITALAAANIIFEFISLLAVRRAKREKRGRRRAGGQNRAR